MGEGKEKDRSAESGQNKCLNKWKKWVQSYKHSVVKCAFLKNIFTTSQWYALDSSYKTVKRPLMATKSPCSLTWIKRSSVLKIHWGWLLFRAGKPQLGERWRQRKKGAIRLADQSLKHEHFPRGKYPSRGRHSLISLVEMKLLGWSHKNTASVDGVSLTDFKLLPMKKMCI